jgi:hypothetical protein
MIVQDDDDCWLGLRPFKITMIVGWVEGWGRQNELFGVKFSA